MLESKPSESSFPDNFMLILETTAKILAEGEKTSSSVRNSFFQYFKNRDFKRKFYNSVYHFCMETIRRKNLLDEYLKKSIDLKKLDLFTLSLFRIGTFISHNPSYQNNPLYSPKIIQKTIHEIIQKFYDLDYTVLVTKNLEKSFTVTLAELFEDKDELQRVALEFYHPLWLVKYLVNVIGRESTINLLKANNQPKIVYTRVNTLVTTRNKIIEELANEKIPAEKDEVFSDLIRVKKGPLLEDGARHNVALSLAVKKGQLFIQGRASAAVSHILAPKPNEIVVDVAAAPGMKTSHICQLMNNQGKIISIDVADHRLKKLNALTVKIGKQTINIVQADSRFPPLRTEIADRLLIDAPCSSTGILRKYPDHKWIDFSQIEVFSQLQEEIILKSLPLLKPGGVGVYSVCSLMEQEGEKHLLKLKKQRGIKLVDPGYGSPGYQREKYKDLPCRRFFPHLHETDGFFIAKFEKIEE
ncbi:MAG: RsmB/NOP family class I SAM-dependent RNA methyltransferase [Candidatus Hermodarchaeota archaeon]